MRRDIVVTYDISDPIRLRKVLQVMKGFGDHLQYSVFRCYLSDTEKFRMLEALVEVIHRAEDQVLLVDLGAVEPGRRRSFEVLGRPTVDPERAPKVF